MQPHILTIPDDGVYEQLVQLAAAAGLHIAEDGLVSKPIQTATTPPDINQLSREQLLAIIRRGGDGKSVPGPLAWQREQGEGRTSVQKARLAALQPQLSEAERRQHMEIIGRGGSGKSIQDPAAWQREIRQDRPLPGRD